MIDRVTVAAWLDNYVHAWKSANADAIGSLFSEDAVYYYKPFDEPVVGREAIVASWLQEPAQPNAFDGEYEPLVVEGNVAVANGRTRYYSAGTIVGAEYDNIFVLRFDDAGKCVEFREWFMKK